MNFALSGQFHKFWKYLAVLDRRYFKRNFGKRCRLILGYIATCHQMKETRFFKKCNM